MTARLNFGAIGLDRSLVLSIHVQLERFEGPLGLLLHLIREQEMDIFNIQIGPITRQYLDYIRAMRRLDLEVAGEFIAMAATLLHIKSKMLLPQYNEEGEEVHEDPRKELVQKLLEYKKIKELSVDLYKLPLLNRDVFARGFREDLESLEEGELVLEEKPLFSLIAAFRFAMKNAKKAVHKVGDALQSISMRIMEMKDLLEVGKRVVFGQFITVTEPGEKRSGQVLLTFLSLLELAKMGFVSLFQSEAFAEIHVEAKKPIDRDVIAAQAENYDSVNADEKAEQIFAKQMSLQESTVIPEDMPDEAEDDAQLELGTDGVSQELDEFGEPTRKAVAPEDAPFEEIASDEDIEAEERKIAEEEAAARGIPLMPVEEIGIAADEAAVASDVPASETEPAPATEPETPNNVLSFLTTPEPDGTEV